MKQDSRQRRNMRNEENIFLKKSGLGNIFMDVYVANISVPAVLSPGLNQ